MGLKKVTGSLLLLGIRTMGALMLRFMGLTLWRRDVCSILLRVLELVVRVNLVGSLILVSVPVTVLLTLWTFLMRTRLLRVAHRLSAILGLWDRRVVMMICIGP